MIQFQQSSSKYTLADFEKSPNLKLSTHRTPPVPKKPSAHKCPRRSAKLFCGRNKSTRANMTCSEYLFTAFKRRRKLTRPTSDNRPAVGKPGLCSSSSMARPTQIRICSDVTCGRDEVLTVNPGPTAARERGSVITGSGFFWEIYIRTCLRMA